MRETWTVEILHRDSHCTYTHHRVVSVHEEGSYTVLFLESNVALKFPTASIWRLRCTPEEPV